MKQKEFSGIVIGNIQVSFGTYDEIISVMDESIEQRQPRRFGYANAHSIVLGANNTVFREALQSCTVLYADGTGIHLAAVLLGSGPVEFRQNRNATDLNEAILQYAHQHHRKIYVLGTTDGSLQKLRAVLGQKYSGIIITGMSNGFNDAEEASLIDRINNSGAEILMIGMGSPQQEVWMFRHRDWLHVPVTIAVGSFLDFTSGAMRRAPMWVRSIRLEWLYRLLQEPRRLFLRYGVGIPKFLYLIVQQKIGR